MFKKLLLGLFLLSPFYTASATLFSFDGNLTNREDVATIAFTLNNDATDVRVWTDSYNNGSLNMDPITALWNAVTGVLIAENDDDASIDPTSQTSFDSGFSLATLAAGSYLFTIANYDNFAAGTNLSDGFTFDNDVSQTTIGWDQPATGVLVNDYWHVQLDGVDSAQNPNAPIPEPSAIALMGLGLLGFGVSRRKYKTK